jgi:hypothetical protein
MKNSIFGDLTPCGSCKNPHSSETSVLTKGTRRNIQEDGILCFTHEFFSGVPHIIVLKRQLHFLLDYLATFLGF